MTNFVNSGEPLSGVYSALHALEQKIEEVTEEQRNIRLIEMMEKRWGFKRVDNND
jgi:hypothetical protein